MRSCIKVGIVGGVAEMSSDDEHSESDGEVFEYSQWTEETNTILPPKNGPPGSVQHAKYIAFTANMALMNDHSGDKDVRAFLKANLAVSEADLYIARVQHLMRAKLEADATPTREYHPHRAGTLVQHTLEGGPLLYYMLEGPRARIKGDPYKGRNWLGEFHHAASHEVFALDLLKTIREFCTTLGGEVADEAFRHDPGPRRELERLGLGLADVLGEPNLRQAKMGTRVEYSPDQEVFQSALQGRDHKLEMYLWKCLPKILPDGPGFLKDPAMTIMNEALSSDPNQASLFVKLVVYHSEGTHARHNLCLTPYVEGVQAVTLMQGEAPHKPRGKPEVTMADQKTFLIKPRVAEHQRRRGPNVVRARIPYAETDVGSIMIQHVDALSQDSARQLLDDATALQASKTASLGRTKDMLPLLCHFYSEQGLCMMFLKFNSADPTIQDIPELRPEDVDRDMFYLMSLRYPVLDLNMDAVMHGARYRWFRHRAGLPEAEVRAAFKEWGRGGWDFGDEWPIRVVDTSHKDSRGRVVHPLEEVGSLPPGGTYHAMEERWRRRHPGEEPPHFHFFVNDMTDDGDEVYIKRYRDMDEGTWNELALIRINIQVLCSQAAVASGAESFYDFRRRVLRPHDPNVDHPFRYYLHTYPRAMEVWREEWADPLVEFKFSPPGGRPERPKYRPKDNQNGSSKRKVRRDEERKKAEEAEAKRQTEHRRILDKKKKGEKLTEGEKEFEDEWELEHAGGWRQEHALNRKEYLQLVNKKKRGEKLTREERDQMESYEMFHFKKNAPNGHRKAPKQYNPKPIDPFGPGWHSHYAARLANELFLTSLLRRPAY